jgi:5'-methylthioadenosine phosphorylase
MVTDYDVWHASAGTVSVEAVVGNLLAMTSAVQRIVEALAEASAADCAHGCHDALANAIISAPEHVSAATRERLALLAGRYLPPA